MENPRPEKVAVVDEVRDRLSNAQAALLTEYRGISVSDLSALRRALRSAGGEYKVYKNTLVRFAARELGLELDDLLVGPTAIAFVPTDSTGDPVTVAKALRDFAKGNDKLVVKGGVLGEKLLSADDAKALADVAPREELLARMAGLIQAPMAQMAGLLQAPLRDFANLLQALIDENGGAPAESSTADAADAAAATGDEDGGDAGSTASNDEPPAEAAADATDESPAEAPADADTNDAAADAADAPSEES